MSKQTEIQWGEVAESIENNMLDWKEVKVEDIKADFAHALSTGPFGSAISSKYFLKSGFPVIRGANLSQNVAERLSDDGLAFISPEKAQEFRRSVVRKGDLIFTCWGTINQVGLIDGRSKYKEYVISNKQMKLTPDPEKADPYFLYYLFSSPDYQSRILNNDIGSSVPGFNLGQLKKMEMLLPSASEQRAIAAVLSSLDDKIDLLHRQNATLEALAETLFRQWFVEEAKEDWENGCIGDLFTLQRGFDLPIQNRIPGRFPILTSSGYSAGHNEFKIKAPGVTTGRSGVIGKVFFVMEDFWPLNTSLFIKEYKLGTPLFSYFILKFADLEGFNAGSAVPTLNRNHVHAHVAPIPPKDLINRFEEVAYPHFKKIYQNTNQIQSLTTLRNMLLPKLISGEVRVSK